MDWQYPATLVIVTLAAVVVVRSLYHAVTNAGKAGCGTGCGRCPTPADEPPPGRIRLPQV